MIDMFENRIAHLSMPQGITLLKFHSFFYTRVCIDNVQNVLILQVFAQLLQAPLDDAEAIVKERFPVPRLVICDQHGSQVINLNY